MYPVPYGTTCAVHIEPGHTSCYYVDKGTQKAPHDPNDKDNKDKMADWCDDEWCYIDPCNCNAPKQFASDYFGPLTYTYLTCGSADAYTSTDADAGANAATCSKGPSGSSGSSGSSGTES